MHEPRAQQEKVPVAATEPRLADPGSSASGASRPGTLELGGARRAARTPPSGSISPRHPAPVQARVGRAPDGGKAAFVNHHASSGACVDATQERLFAISARFSHFEEQVEQDAKARKEAEQVQFEEIYGRCTRLEQQVRSETRCWEEAHLVLRGRLEWRLAEAQGQLETLFLEKFDEADSRVNALSEHMSRSESMYAQTSENYVREMTEESATIHSDYWEFRRAFQDELARHQDHQRILGARVAELEQRTAKQLANEKQVGEEKLSQLARSATEVRQAGEEESVHYQETVLAQVEVLRSSLREACRDRVQADDDIVAALNHYTRSLQSAVASVSRTSLASMTTL